MIPKSKKIDYNEKEEDEEEQISSSSSSCKFVALENVNKRIKKTSIRI
jgi:hypothetical protein